ncbi:CRISPR-associated protein Csx11, partial [Schnuerera sp.]|uniref:CRISPR-associated protein Csx11 n=1 Tax=Schnuerera sp. TaxID=2794844 RepID=UPI002CAFC442
MSNLNLKNLKENSKEILKAETGTLLFNLGKTHIGFWERKNGNIHFDIDEDEFIDIYGYKLFSEYGDYYKETKGIFNARSPFEIDMDSINDELKDFFNKTEIKLKFKNKNNEIEENLTLTDIVKGNVSDKGLIKNVMFRGCENINSGIDKGAPKKQLDNLHIVNAFGTTKEEITNKKKRYTNKKYYDETRIDFFINLWRKLGSLGKINIDVYKMRKFIINQVENWYIHLLSDSRFPANDVTLWDQAYMTASMFKASIAALCLDGEKHEQYMEYPRTIRWSILGIQYDKLGLAEKALNPSFIYWYRNKAEEVDEKIKEVVEEEYALGNEIYRDETGIYFIVPENICGKKLGDDVGLYRLDKKLDDLQEKVLECFNLFDGEAFPSIFVTEPSRGTMNMAFLIENAKENFLKPVYPKSNFIKEYFGNMAQDKKFKVICDICRMRLANKDEDDDLNLCKVCAKRQRENERTKINDDYKETIWTGELQDKNERIALVTMKFELGEWLNGNMLNTILNSNTEYVSDNIWEEALEEIEDLLKDINK